MKRFILWDYSRGSWQYDVMVGLIVLFVLFTPRAWFRDQPRIPHVKEIGNQVFWVEPELVAPFSIDKREVGVSAILKQKYGKSLTVNRLESIYDSEHEEIKGYVAFVQ